MTNPQTLSAAPVRGFSAALAAFHWRWRAGLLVAGLVIAIAAAVGLLLLL